MGTVDKVHVSQSELIAAVSVLLKMKRGPRRSFDNKMPKDTLLYAVDAQFIVSTPARRTAINMSDYPGLSRIIVQPRTLPACDLRPCGRSGKPPVRSAWGSSSC